MTTEAQVEANRRNARKSTGPRTRAGKRRSRTNATKHGILWRQVLLTDDVAEDLLEYRWAMMKRLKPTGQLENLLAEMIVTHSWRLRRALWMERGMLELDIGKVHYLQDKHSPGGDDGHLHPMVVGDVVRQSLTGVGNAFETLRRYETSIQRAMFRAIAELERLQARRMGRSANSTDLREEAIPGFLPERPIL
ncbi:MAG TPA: hypothetical protein VNA25_10305 [Phycisphaerae bacterium]|nr:hypothetical protein [Phycisphaerae bacterium]